MGTGGGKSKTTVGAETVAQLVEKANCEAYRIICEGQYLCTYTCSHDPKLQDVEERWLATPNPLWKVWDEVRTPVPWGREHDNFNIYFCFIQATKKISR